MAHHALRVGLGMIGVSTVWNAKRHETARAIFDELKPLGYTHFEINVHFSEEMVEEAVAMVRAGELQVLSVHNYCPVPPGIERAQGSGGLFPVSSADPELRRNAVKWGRRSIETAARLAARMVVGHWGLVEMPDAGELQAKAIEGLRAGDRSALRPLRDAAERREEMKREPLERALDTFSQLIPTARANGVRLGLENRNFFHEIPSLDEVGLFLELAPDVAAYWHDIGHAEILEYVELYPHHAYRDRWADKCMGVHVHDVDRGRDHLAIGRGQIDFRAELAAFPKSAPWIPEVHYGDPEEMAATCRELRRLEQEMGRE
jgi:sugar phosphate isomerase/epimerase